MPNKTQTDAILRFRCSKCQRAEFVHSQRDLSDGGYIIDENWYPVQGWLRIYSTPIGMGAAVQTIFCTRCKVEVLAMLGYTSVNSFENMVKANEDIYSSVNTNSSPVRVLSDDTDDEDVPFYLLEENDDFN